MTCCIRRCVSQGRSRFTEDGFDLDLTYITDRFIAMGYPCSGCESLYRNSLSDVVRFFEQRHAGGYRIYNLCAEPKYANGYTAADFDGRVEHFPFVDHGPPPLQYLRQFCESAERWLEASDTNVVAVHCKAGKGRTGVFVCAYLMHSLGLSADAAIERYLEQRGGGGVQNPCQLRWIHYFGERRLLSNPWFRGLRRVIRMQLRDSKPRSAGEKTWIGRYASTGVAVNEHELTRESVLNDDGSLEWQLSGGDPINLCGDFFCSVSKDVLVWAHTEFIPEDDKLVFSKSEIDHMSKDRQETRTVEFCIWFEPCKVDRGSCISEVPGNTTTTATTNCTTLDPEASDKSSIEDLTMASGSRTNTKTHTSDYAGEFMTTDDDISVISERSTVESRLSSADTAAVGSHSSL